LKQKRFGWPAEKFEEKPKEWGFLGKQYMQNKLFVYNVKSLSLHWSKDGQGQTGARHFRYSKIPPLRYWNPDVAFNELKYVGVRPKISLEMEDGTTKDIPIVGLKEDEIWSKVSQVTGKKP